MVREMGLENKYVSDSAAATTEEIGNPIYPPMRKTLETHDVKIGNHRARLIMDSDLEKFDYILVMDRENHEDLEYMFRRNENLSKVKYLKSFSKGTNNNNQISDPWYTRDFELAYRDIRDSVAGLLEWLERG